MKIAFFGTPDFAVATLQALQNSDHQVLFVATQPDRPRGRGMKVTPSPVKKLALEYELPILQPERLPDPAVTDTMQKMKPDAVVVVAYGLKIPPELLYGPKYGAINLHGSLLPKYRGAAPMQRAIMNGDPVVGVTTMKMDEGWDTGAILKKAEIPLEPLDNLGTVHDRLAKIGADLMVETLHLLEAGACPAEPQDDTLATTAPKITDDDRWIDWQKSSWAIHNQIRALDPVPGCLTLLGGEKVRIWRSIPEKFPGAITEATPGTILQEERNTGIWVKTGDGALLITEIQAEGGKRMPVTAYLLGHPLTTDVRFGE
ncbi:MAG TPA: methionyl-tRNA formyltransferase [Firmicutes bacterium]|jgi:methionyl-tRNA formyltransferase|nr:methionyl-tRNA formyltransferase [Bacillota bacterium]HOQ24929.1 methionyl-tRNA formyltransferase [Bacillota bacterium]HPT68299.1 methionyl-tRNA formyltransferase [Bacillota bacterium]